MKKLLFCTLLMTLSFRAFSYVPHIKLSDNINAVSLVSYAEVESVKKKGKHTLVEVRFIVGGCMDLLGPVAYSGHYNFFKRKYILGVSAVTLHNTASENVRCFAPNYKFVTFKVPRFVNSKNIKLKTLSALDTRKFLKGRLATKMMAIGGETTGTVLKLEESSVELIIPSHLKEKVEKLDKELVKIKGEYVELGGIERPNRVGFKVESIELIEE